MSVRRAANCGCRFFGYPHPPLFNRSFQFKIAVLPVCNPVRGGLKDSRGM
jgi:hypothetical protein